MLSCILSWTACLGVGVLAPVLLLELCHCPGCEEFLIIKFELCILASLAAVSLLCISHNLCKHGLRKFLFVDRFHGHMISFHMDYVGKIKKIPLIMAGRRPGDAEIVYASTDKAAWELNWTALIVILLMVFQRSIKIVMRQSAKVRMYLMSGIFSIIFVAVAGHLSDTSSFLKEVGGCNFGVQSAASGNNIMGCIPCSQKYLLESYFGKPRELLDSEFYGYLCQKFRTSSYCKDILQIQGSIVKLSSLRRHLIGEGSHRHIVSSVELGMPTLLKLPSNEETIDNCEVVVIERLPSGVFADPFELQHLVQRGVFIDAAVFGDTNLELPSALSNRSVVEVHVSINLHLTNHKQGPKVTVEIPLHARYPPLSHSGYEEIKIDDPDLLIRCEVHNMEHDNCLWMLVSPDEESASRTGNNTVWNIPSGNEAHVNFVSTITFISALVAALSIVLTTLFYASSPINLQKKNL